MIDDVHDTERIIEYYMDDQTLFVYVETPDGNIICETWELQAAEPADKDNVDFTGISWAELRYTGPFPNRD